MTALRSTQLTGSQARRRSRALRLAPAHDPAPGDGRGAQSGLAKPGSARAGSTRNPCPKGKRPRRCRDPPAFAAYPRLAPPSSPRPSPWAEPSGSRVPANPLLRPGPEGAPGLRNEGHLGEGQWQRLDPLQVPESPGLRRHPNTQHPHGHLPSGGTRGPHAPPLARSFCRAARAGTAPARPAQRTPGLAEMRAPRTRAHLAALAPAAAPPAASAPPLPSAARSPPTLCAVATPAALSGQGPRATHAGAAAVGAPDRPAFRSD